MARPQYVGKSHVDCAPASPRPRSAAGAPPPYFSPARRFTRARSRSPFLEVNPSAQQSLPTCDTATAPSGYPAFSPSVPPDQGGDVFSVTTPARHMAQNAQPLAEREPCLVPGYVARDHCTFTTKTKVHSGLASAQFDGVALLDTGSSQSFITRNAWERMARSGAATTICETQTLPRSWGGFGKSPPLQTSITVRLSMQFVHNDQPTASLAV